MLALANNMAARLGLLDDDDMRELSWDVDVGTVEAERGGRPAASNSCRGCRQSRRADGATFDGRTAAAAIPARRSRDGIWTTIRAAAGRNMVRRSSPTLQTDSARQLSQDMNIRRPLWCLSKLKPEHAARVLAICDDMALDVVGRI